MADMTQTPEFKTEDIELARKLFAQPCDFMLAAADPEQFPSTWLPEIAFVGRSNVGKSSLINALTGRKGLARASNTPGRTQQIVFFNLAQKIILADVPGYGHAKAPLEEKEKWLRLLEHYLKNRKNLKCVFLLLDSRHGVKDNDIEMMEFLDRIAVIYQAVMTKADYLKESEGASKLNIVKEILARHPAARDHVLLTSADSKSGIAELRAFIAKITG